MRKKFNQSPLSNQILVGANLPRKNNNNNMSIRNSTQNWRQDLAISYNNTEELSL